MTTEADVSHIFSILDSVLSQQQQQQQQHQQLEGTTLPSTSADASAVPLKRRGGRPKGSVTVNRRGPNDPPRIKRPTGRPTGRPRHDGLPAGSLKHLKNKQPAEPPGNASAPAPSLGETEEVREMTNVQHQPFVQSGGGIPDDASLNPHASSAPPLLSRETEDREMADVQQQPFLGSGDDMNASPLFSGESEDEEMTDVQHQLSPPGADDIPANANISESPSSVGGGFQEQASSASARTDSELPSTIVGGVQEQSPGGTVPEVREPVPSVHPSNIDPNLQSPPSVHPSNIDPSLLGDEWLTLLRANDEERFLHALISALTKLPYPSAASGTTVEAAFHSHLVSLTPKENKQQPTASDTPTLYSVMKTFWLPSSPSYFSLTASSSTSRIPSEHRFIYWDPLPLVFNGLACPKCAAPLRNKSRIHSGPIMVHDLERPFYIIGCKYACTNALCKLTSRSNPPSTFASTDTRILGALPEFLRKEFPAHLARSDTPNRMRVEQLGPDTDVWRFKALGVSTALWNMVRGLVAVGMGEDAILGVLRGIRDGRPQPYTQLRPQPYTQLRPQPHPQPRPQPPNAVVYQRKPRPSRAKKKQVYVELPLSHHNPNPSEESATSGLFRAWAANAADPSAATQPNSLFSDDNDTTSAGIVFAGGNPSISAGAQRAAAAIVTRFASPGEKEKRVRTCRKCGLSDCSGRGGRMHCKNGCQDCGKRECFGRQYRTPDTPCNWA